MAETVRDLSGGEQTAFFLATLATHTFLRRAVTPPGMLYALDSVFSLWDPPLKVDYNLLKVFILGLGVSKKKPASSMEEREGEPKS